MRQAAMHVHPARDAVALPEALRPLQLMQYNVSRLLYINYPENLSCFLQSAVIGWLAASLGIEERPVQDDRALHHIQNPCLKDLLERMLVEHQLRLAGDSDFDDILFLRPNVLLGHQRIEVIRQHHCCPHRFRRLAGDLRRNAVRVVKGDHLRERYGLQLPGIALCHLLHHTLSLLQGLGVFLLLLVQDFFDGDKTFSPILVIQPRDLHLDQFCQRQRQFQFLHQPQSATDNQAGQVAGLDIGGNNSVAQHVGEAPSVIDNGIDPFHGLDGLLQLLRGYADAARNFRSQILHGVHIQIYHARQPGILGEDLRVLGVTKIVLDICQVRHLPDQIREDGIVNRGRPFGGPDESFQAVAGVHDVVVHLLIALALDLDGPAGGGLQIHEDKRCQLQASDHDLHAGAGVASACPGILLIGHGQGVHPQAHQ